MRGIGREQPVQRRRAGPWQAGNENRPVNGDGRVLRVPAPCRFAEQASRQCAAQEHAAHLAAERGKVLVTGVRLEQNGQPVAVVVRPEILKTGEPSRGRAKVGNRADATAGPRYQWWYSPQLTSRHCPVIARASEEHKKITASATSSGSGNLRRSVPAAVSS